MGDCHHMQGPHYPYINPPVQGVRGDTGFYGIATRWGSFAGRMGTGRAPVIDDAYEMSGSGLAMHWGQQPTHPSWDTRPPLPGWPMPGLGGRGRNRTEVHIGVYATGRSKS